MSHRLLIEAAELAARLDIPDWVVLDCRFDLADTGRGERDYALAHIPGAHYAHLDRDLSGPISPGSGRHPLPDPRRLSDWLGRHGIESGVQVIAYDDSGGAMAVRVWWLLRWLGHSRVALLDGGWRSWIDAGYPLERTPAVPPVPVEFKGVPDSELLLTTGQVAENLKTGHWLLLDARAAERFRGEQEPIDPVAGHIPGSRNHPLGSNLGPDGRFLPPRVLRANYETSLGGHAPGRVACLCGSGVTACHNLLAMELAGMRGARLYAGSWSEWIRDPGRPVALGEARGLR